MRKQKHSTIATIINNYKLSGKISASRATKLAIEMMPTAALITHTSILSIDQEYLEPFLIIVNEFLASDAGKKHTQKLQNIRVFDYDANFMSDLEHAENLTGFEQCTAFEKIIFKYKIDPGLLSQKINSDVLRRNFTFYTPYTTDLEATDANKNKLTMENQGYEFIKKNGKFYYCKKKS